MIIQLLIYLLLTISSSAEQLLKYEKLSNWSYETSFAPGISKRYNLNFQINYKRNKTIFFTSANAYYTNFSVSNGKNQETWNTIKLIDKYMHTSSHQDFRYSLSRLQKIKKDNRLNKDLNDVDNTFKINKSYKKDMREYKAYQDKNKPKDTEEDSQYSKSLENMSHLFDSNQKVLPHLEFKIGIMHYFMDIKYDYNKFNFNMFIFGESEILQSIILNNYYAQKTYNNPKESLEDETSKKPNEKQEDYIEDFKFTTTNLNSINKTHDRRKNIHSTINKMKNALNIGFGFEACYRLYNQIVMFKRLSIGFTPIGLLSNLDAVQLPYNIGLYQEVKDTDLDFYLVKNTSDPDKAKLHQNTELYDLAQSGIKGSEKIKSLNDKFLVRSKQQKALLMLRKLLNIKFEIGFKFISYDH